MSTANSNNTGRLIGIARRAQSRAPMEELTTGEISLTAGLDGDYRGFKFPKRQITVLAIEDWEAAMAELAGIAGPPDLHWTTRRANLLTEGMRLPRARGAILKIGPVVLEVTDQTGPCHRMEEAYRGLLGALHPYWRGGLTCRVLEPGRVSIGDETETVSSPPEHVIRLPG